MTAATGSTPGSGNYGVEGRDRRMFIPINKIIAFYASS